MKKTLKILLSVLLLVFIGLTSLILLVPSSNKCGDKSRTTLFDKIWGAGKTTCISKDDYDKIVQAEILARQAAWPKDLKTTENWQEYANNKMDFIVKYPNNWDAVLASGNFVDFRPKDLPQTSDFGLHITSNFYGDLAPDWKWLEKNKVQNNFYDPSVNPASGQDFINDIQFIGTNGIRYYAICNGTPDIIKNCSLIMANFTAGKNINK